MDNYPEVPEISGIKVLRATVLSINVAARTITVPIPAGDPEEPDVNTDCYVLHTNQYEFWRNFYYNEPGSGLSFEDGNTLGEPIRANLGSMLCFCLGEEVIVLRHVPSGNFFVVGHASATTYLYYTWPIWPQGIVAGFSGTGFPGGSDFPFLNNNNPNLPINPYTDGLGNTRAIGSSSGVLNPYGVLEPISGGFVFHRQYEFAGSSGDRLPLEPYDLDKVTVGEDYTLGLNIARDRILFCNIPILQIDPLATEDFSRATVISLSPLVLGIWTVESYYGKVQYNAYGVSECARKVYVATMTVYVFEECLRDLINDTVALPLFPGGAVEEYDVDYGFRPHQGDRNWQDQSYNCEDGGESPFGPVALDSQTYPGVLSKEEISLGAGEASIRGAIGGLSCLVIIGHWYNQAWGPWNSNKSAVFRATMTLDYTNSSWETHAEQLDWNPFDLEMTCGTLVIASGSPNPIIGWY